MGSCALPQLTHRPNDDLQSGCNSYDESSSSSFTDESGNSGKLGEPEDPESGDWQPNKKKCPCMKKHAQGTRQMHKCIRKCWKEAQEKYRKWKEGSEDGNGGYEGKEEEKY